MVFDGYNLKPLNLLQLAFKRENFEVEIPLATLKKIEQSHHALLSLLEKKFPIYGVTTGFGDSGSRVISAAQSESLQKNLVSYLLCGSGQNLSIEAARAILAIRLNSLCRGFSGVSPKLVERLKTHLENDWIPVIPREGSLGASGDLIPLAYLANNIQGHGQVFVDQKICEMSEVLKSVSLEPYQLKAKEGLALVNGTSAMAGLFATNLNHAKFILNLMAMHTSWLCLALQGRTEAFDELVNCKSKSSHGQSQMASMVRSLLALEDYSSTPLHKISVENSQTKEWIQDRYSLRCFPQIAGPVLETLELIENWLEQEINSASDNPLITTDEYASGGNFYGGYLSHGMDYLKISLAHLADLIDRQVAYIIDDKSNRGLTPNLANWDELSEQEKFLHHGLKGLHQSVSAITSEILQKSIPGGIFSRSSESHNQDKVSLGMSAAVQCADMLEPLFTITTLQAVILAQALDLRGVNVRGTNSQKYYSTIRNYVPFVKHDQELGPKLERLREHFKHMSSKGEVVSSIKKVL